jgi:hypothetical protein
MIYSRSNLLLDAVSTVILWMVENILIEILCRVAQHSGTYVNICYRTSKQFPKLKSVECSINLQLRKSEWTGTINKVTHLELSLVCIFFLISPS